jgi:hypothetical protein
VLGIAAGVSLDSGAAGSLAGIVGIAAGSLGAAAALSDAGSESIAGMQAGDAGTLRSGIVVATGALLA